MYSDKDDIANRTSEQLAREIIALIEGKEDFDSVARRVFTFQYTFIKPYQNFCRGRGVSPETVTCWQDIPPAPVAAFKQFTMSAAPTAHCDLERGGRTFHSSGTTGAETSRHYLDPYALNVYRVSLRDGFRRFVLPDGIQLPIFALMPPPVSTLLSDGAPHSSLSFMLGELITEYGGAFFALPGWQHELAEHLARLEYPIVLFGTAFAFIHFFDAVTTPFTLPAGSRIVETGGFKGRSREVSREELYALFTERFGVPPTHCVSEYGMSEMASQFYDATLVDAVRGIERPPRKLAAPTIRTRIIDPLTGTDAKQGEAGLLAHYDVCNLNSLMGIQTEDMGRFAADGDGFELLGRAPGAVLRGCSLTAEEWQARSGSAS